MRKSLSNLIAHTRFKFSPWPRASCPARFLIPELEEARQNQEISRVVTRQRRTVLAGEHSEYALPRESDEPPYAPGRAVAKPLRGIWKKIEVFKAQNARCCFKKLFGCLRAPFRNQTSIQDLRHILTLVCFLVVNLMPVYVFSLIVFSDYAVLSVGMPAQLRVLWLHGLYYITWLFVAIYAINVGRLLCTLLVNLPHHFWWVDWEETLYRSIQPQVFRRIKDAADSLWESYHRRTWGYIRGIQAEVREKKQAIHEIAEARNLPPLVEDLICSFVCLEGAEELDYRWHLHDNRNNMGALEGVDYNTRECIASFLIPEPAFRLNKDQIVDLYCA